MRIKKLYLKTIRVRKFLHDAGVKPVSFILPIILSFAAAMFDGLSLGLLVPLAKGVIGMDFSFVIEMPVFKTIIHSFPKVFIETTRPNSSIFILLLGIIFVSTVMKNILSYFSLLAASYQSNQFFKNMQNLIFSRYLNFGKLFFDRANMGQLNIVLTDFTKEVSDILKNLRTLIYDIFTLIIYSIVMCIISWRLTMFSLFLFPALFYSLNWLVEKIKISSRFYAEARIIQSWKIFDILSCIPLIKSYCRERKEKERFFELSKSVARLKFNIDKKLLLVLPIQEIVVVTALLIIISAGAFLFVKGRTTAISSFLVFFYILRRCAPLFNSLNEFKTQLAGVEGLIKNISQVLNDKDKFFIPEGNKSFDGLKEKIEFKNLNFSYVEGIRIIKGVSFSIEKGKITALVGPTGGGKTTLINLILRFYDSTPSSIFIDGTDIRDFTLESLRTQMALVSQEILLFNDTIRYNIAYGVDEKPADEKLIDAAKKARLYDFIMNLPDKFDTLIGDKGVKLSGGEKQRLSIARMFLRGSDILMLDEATSALDTKTERLIQEAIEEAIKDKTTIVIAHRLSTIKKADKIIVIGDGRAIEQGTLSELLDKKGKFYEYWEAQKFY